MGRDAREGAGWRRWSVMMVLLGSAGTAWAQSPDPAPTVPAPVASNRLFAEPVPAPPPAAVPARSGPPAGPANQYLFGSGEAAALSRATWAALVDYVTRAIAAPHRQGVVLVAGSTLQAPRFDACDNKPLAVVTDVDESAILNVGWQYDDAVAGGRRFDLARWRRWEQEGAARVAPTPGAVEAVARLRALGVEVVFNSNRDAATTDGTVRALAAAGLGRAEPGRTLFLREDGQPSGKDARRAAIAGRFCVVAMLGDQLGDFSDLFDTGLSPLDRRAATTMPAIADLWGEGWFLLPNPLYGTALKGGTDEVFPASLRWSDPGPAGTVAGPAPVPSAPPAAVVPPVAIPPGSGAPSI